MKNKIKLIYTGVLSSIIILGIIIILCVSTNILGLSSFLGGIGSSSKSEQVISDTYQSGDGAEQRNNTNDIKMKNQTGFIAKNNQFFPGRVGNNEFNLNDSGTSDQYEAVDSDEDNFYYHNLKTPENLLSAMDINEDRKIAFNEFDGPEIAFDAMDRNKDDFIDEEELQKVYEAIHIMLYPDSHKDFDYLSLKDKNKDGLLSMEEASMSKALYQKLDSDKDGFLSANEVSAIQ